jgi:Acetyltransferase (GNAT) domain
MIPAFHIRYLRRDQIDVSQWEACIDSSPNGLLYGRSFFLDTMTGYQWDALVLDDYAAIMPLTWRRKAGIRYLYQPAFTQQTGIFSAAPVTPELVNAFLTVISRRFRFAEIFLNYGNKQADLKPHANFVLPLHPPYETLHAGYQQNLVRNLRKAEQSSLQYVRDADLRSALRDCRQEYAHRSPHLKERDYHDLEELCLQLQQQGRLLTRAVIGPKDEALASAVLLRDDRRFYLLQFTALPAGRQFNASHWLIDRFIHEWAGAAMTLDFEGSDAPGLGRFYHSFGSIDQPFYFYRLNRLPWPFRLLK